MVVLEGGGMLTSSGNQYLQPDYLSPLPTTLDAKKSPLALLAQTCSQIGADSPTAKPLISTLDKPKKSGSSAPATNTGENVPRSSPTVSAKSTINVDKVSRSTPTENKSVAFKPYENTVTKKQSGDERPTSKSSSAVVINVDNFNCDEKKSESRCSTTSSSRRSVSSPSMAIGGSTTPAPADIGKTTPVDNRKSTSPTTSSTRGASPIIRSGLEILQGHPKDMPLGAYKPSMSSLGLSGPLSSLCCPPGLEHANPAFRSPFPASGPYSHHHHHAAAAAAMLAAGYPPSAPSPYVSYARVKTPSGGEALVPVCKDPYCTGCQFSMHNQQLMMGAANPTGACPSGCTQCDHQKYGLAMAMSLVPPGPLPPTSLAYPHQLGAPYVCNWIAGESYCGKRFRTSEELLQHLRTHTSIAGAADAAAAAAAAAVATSTANSLLNHPHSLFSQAVLHRAAAAAYPNPPLSPLSAARYHPYTKPGLPSSLGASPYSAFNPAPLTSPYYSPYSLYGQRLGAAVHP